MANLLTREEIYFKLKKFSKSHSVFSSLLVSSDSNACINNTMISYDC